MHLKRKSIAVGSIICILTGCWIAWAAIAHHRLAVQIAQIRTDGDPVLPQDFPAANVPDDQNAAKYFADAAAAMDQNNWPPSSSNLRYNDYPPFPAEWYRLADAAVVANTKTLELARQARKFDRFDWGFVNTPAYSKNDPALTYIGFVSILNPLRALANLLGDAALDAHLHGDDADAIERIAEGLYLAKIINSGGGIIANLSGIAVDDLITEKLEAIAGRLQIEGAVQLPSAPTGKNIRRVRRSAVQAVIRQLLDRGAPQWQHDALIRGRTETLQYFKCVGGHQLLLRPMFDLAAARSLKADEPFVRAAGAGDWASARAILFALPPNTGPMPTGAKPQNPPRYSRIIPENYLPIQILQLNWLWIAQRRAAAVSLASQLYRADHSKWPQTLEDLHPDYLSMLPPDPFGNGNGIGYILEPIAGPWGANRPMVYTNQASSLLGAPPAVPCYGWQNGAVRWLDVSSWSPPPSTAPAAKPE
jgi:hypothetical protein